MMDPTYALVILATLAATRPFFELSETREKAAALRRAGYRHRATTGCFYLLLLVPGLALWWYYALATNQVLLGVIPSIGMAAAIIAIIAENLAAKQPAERRR